MFPRKFVPVSQPRLLTVAAAHPHPQRAQSLRQVETLPLRHLPLRRDCQPRPPNLPVPPAKHVYPQLFCLRFQQISHRRDRRMSLAFCQLESRPRFRPTPRHNLQGSRSPIRLESRLRSQPPNHQKLTQLYPSERLPTNSTCRAEKRQGHRFMQLPLGCFTTINRRYTR